jgi:uncharacterized damage-inducible protein DinB
MNMLRRTALAIALLIAAPTALNAQQPIVDSLRWLFERTSGNVMATAELLDESLYGYRPTPEVRTAGEILAHIAFSQFQFCAAAAGERNPNSEQFEETRTTKASILDALEKGFAYCASVYDRTTDADAGRQVTFLSQSTTAGVLAFNSAHIYEHYGNLVTYMRLNGIVPPSSA